MPNPHLKLQPYGDCLPSGSSSYATPPSSISRRTKRHVITFQRLLLHFASSTIPAPPKTPYTRYRFTTSAIRDVDDMASNPLRPQAVLQGMADALPTHEKGDTTSDMSSSFEAIALFTHACMVALGFRLIGFHEDEKIGKLCLSHCHRP